MGFIWFLWGIGCDYNQVGVFVCVVIGVVNQFWGCEWGSVFEVEGVFFCVFFV